MKFHHISVTTTKGFVPSTMNRPTTTTATATNSTCDNKHATRHRRIHSNTKYEKLTKQKTLFQKLLESDHHMAMVLSYCGVFLVYGMTDELLGPTLIELSCLVSRPLETTSWMFFSHDVGLLFGTLFGGLIVSRLVFFINFY